MLVTAKSSFVTPTLSVHKGESLDLDSKLVADLVKADFVTVDESTPKKTKEKKEPNRKGGKK